MLQRPDNRSFALKYELARSKSIFTLFLNQVLGSSCPGNDLPTLSPHHSNMPQSLERASVLYVKGLPEPLCMLVNWKLAVRQTTLATESYRAVSPQADTMASNEVCQAVATVPLSSLCAVLARKAIRSQAAPAGAARRPAAAAACPAWRTCT